MYLVNILKEALINTFFIIKKEFKKLENIGFTAEEIRRVEYKDDENIVKLMIFKSMFMEIVDATEAVYNTRMNGMEKQYLDLINEYTTYMDLVKAKFYQLCPDVVTSKHKRDEENLTKFIENQFADRLTTNDSIRIPIFQRYSVVPHDVEDEPYMDDLLNTNSTIILLLEVRAWALTVKQHADLMNNDIQPAVSTMAHTQTFSNDRIFLKEIGIE